MSEINTYKDILDLLEKFYHGYNGFAAHSLERAAEKKSSLFTQPVMEEVLNALVYAPNEYVDKLVVIFGDIVQKNPQSISPEMIEQLFIIMFKEYPRRFRHSYSFMWKNIFSQKLVNERIARDLSNALENPKIGYRIADIWYELAKHVPNLIDEDMLISLSKMKRRDSGGGVYRVYSGGGYWSLVFGLVEKGVFTQKVFGCFIENLHIHEHPGARINIVEFLIKVLENYPEFASDKTASSIGKAMENEATSAEVRLLIKILEINPDLEIAQKLFANILQNKDLEFRKSIMRDILYSVGTSFDSDLPKILSIILKILREAKQSPELMDLVRDQIGVILVKIEQLGPEQISKEEFQDLTLLIDAELIREVIEFEEEPTSLIKRIYSFCSSEDPISTILREKYPTLGS
ncbi:MAG: hypothetical protein BAJALOKI2v1_70005 [Promethearchaeota archaeon]|nr:MAG: hypothetical protein BAJALOKI2v1_70005 [Candidatus Lokiarchaeota archaeon]